eukprot:6198453-Pleurochrysis_carterae.AAC.1
MRARDATALSTDRDASASKSSPAHHLLFSSSSFAPSNSTEPSSAMVRTPTVLPRPFMPFAAATTWPDAHLPPRRPCPRASP